MDQDLAALIVAVVAATVSLVALILGAANRRQDRRDQQRERAFRGEHALDEAFDAILEWTRERTESSWRALEARLERAAELLPADHLRLVRYRSYYASQSGDHAAALSLLEAVTDSPDARGRFWLDVAGARVSAEATEDAIEDALARARTDRQYAAEAIVRQARRLQSRGRTQEALALVAEAEPLGSRTASVHRAKAELLMERARAGIEIDRSVDEAREALLTAIELAPAEGVGDLIHELAGTYQPYHPGALPAPSDADLWMSEQLRGLAASAGSRLARHWRTAVTADAAAGVVRDRASAEASLAQALDGWRTGEHPDLIFGAIHATLRQAAPYLAGPDTRPADPSQG